MNKKLKVIAEAGVNHNGDVKMAIELIDIAKASGADYVKFQTFEVANLVSRDTPLAAYQESKKHNLSNQNDLLSGLALTHEEFASLSDHCKKLNIGFLSTPFDVFSLRFLVEELDMPVIKIASGDLTYGPLLFEASKYGLPLIVSTGMANLSEIQDAIELIEFGLSISAGQIKDDLLPTRENRRKLWDSKSDFLVSDLVTLLHCTSQYPAPPEALNLNAINTMRSTFNLPVGYSDHSASIGISCGAVALGATVIEKHFTLDKMLEGPDHAASLEPQELNFFVSELRSVEESLGSSSKECHPVEEDTKKVARRSIRANTIIHAGDKISINSLSFSRPNGKTSPMNAWDIAETTAIKNYLKDEEL